jgi:hypothetical protein
MALRIGLVNWSRRRAGGVETYLEFLIPRLVGDGHPVALLSEVDHPVDRDTITTTGLEEWCIAALGADRAVPALRHWAPDVLLMNGLADLALERRILGIAPAARRTAFRQRRRAIACSDPHALRRSIRGAAGA